jgi:hypothetical protein
MSRQVWVTLLLLGGLALAGCGGQTKQSIAPGARVIYHGGAWGVFSVCDRGSRVYLSDLGPGALFVVPNGCADGTP